MGRTALHFHSQRRPLTPLSSLQRKEGVDNSQVVGMVMTGVGEALSGEGDGGDGVVGVGAGPPDPEETTKKSFRFFAIGDQFRSIYDASIVLTREKRRVLTFETRCCLDFRMMGKTTQRGIFFRDHTASQCCRKKWTEHTESKTTACLSTSSLDKRKTTRFSRLRPSNPRGTPCK